MATGKHITPETYSDEQGEPDRAAILRGDLPRMIKVEYEYHPEIIQRFSEAWGMEPEEVEWYEIFERPSTTANLVYSAVCRRVFRLETLVQMKEFDAEGSFRVHRSRGFYVPVKDDRDRISGLAYYNWKGVRIDV